MALALKTTRVGTVAVVHLYGRLVSGKPVESLQAAIANLLQDGLRAMVWNLSEVSYIDSAGLGQLLCLYGSVRGEGGRIALLSPSSRAGLLLQIVKLATVFDMYDDETEAIDSVLRASGAPGSRP